MRKHIVTDALGHLFLVLDHTNQQVLRGVYHDVSELINAIEYFIENCNDRAQPFIWTKIAKENIIPGGRQTTGHFRNMQ